MNVPFHQTWNGLYYPFENEWEDGFTDETYYRTADTKMKLCTGGKAVPQLKQIWIGTCPTSEILQKRATPKWSWYPDLPTRPIASTKIILGELGQLGSDGLAYKALQDDTTVNVTPRVDGVDFYIFPEVEATKYVLVHQTQCTALTNTNNDRTTIGAGEKVDLSGMPDVTQWTVSFDGSVSPTNGAGTTLTAPGNHALVVVRAEMPNGAHVYQPFNVLEPSGVQFLNPPLGKKHSQYYCEAGFHAQVIVLPTSVSFANIGISELEATITADGCYDSYNGWSHNRWTYQPGGRWLQPDCNNYLPTNVDYCWLPSIAPHLTTPHYYAGNFSCPIPWNYRLHGAANDGYNFATATQTTMATDTGKCPTSKSTVSVSFEANDSDMEDF